MTKNKQSFTQKKQIALIELGGSHDECLYAQIAALKHHNYEIHLITDEKLAARLGKDAEADHHQILQVNKSFLQDIKSLFLLRKYLIKNNISKAVINTAEGKLIRNLCFIISSKTEITGILHNGKKLIKSGTQKLISKRIKKYFVLNDYIKDALKDINNSLKIESFYPVFFPEFQLIPLQKGEEEFWVCIPGQLEIKRRDYVGLLQALANNKKLLSTENKTLKFILLGNGSHTHGNGAEIKTMAKELDIEKHFIFFDSFISNHVFYSYITESDIIMPLIHPETDGFENYLHYQVSGTYNLAFGFARPMLMHEAFINIEDLEKTSWFYKSAEEIPYKLEKLLNNHNLIIQKENEILKIDKFSLAYQSKKYIDFIENRF